MSMPGWEGKLYYRQLKSSAMAVLTIHVFAFLTLFIVYSDTRDHRAEIREMSLFQRIRLQNKSGHFFGGQYALQSV